MIAEINLIEKPFFILGRRRTKKYKNSLRLEGDNKIGYFSWSVATIPKYGLPAAFDYRVFQGINKLVTENMEQDGAILNSIDFSIYRLAKVAGISYQTSNIKRIKTSITRISATLIHSENAYYLKNKKCYLTMENISIFKKVVFTGDDTAESEKSGTNTIYFGDFYFKNLKSFYSLSLNYNYILNLKNIIAIKLYQLLSIKFYGGTGSFIQYSYKTLCETLPLPGRKSFSFIKAQLDPSLNELVETLFLRKYVWKKNKNNYILRLFPGDRYYLEQKIRENNRRQFLGEKIKKSEPSTYVNLREQWTGKKEGLKNIKKLKEDLKKI